MSEALRILFITRKWAPAVGGMEVYSQRLTEELALRHEVQVVALRGRSDGRPPSALSLMLFPLTVLHRCFSGLGRPAIIHLGDMAIWPLACVASLFAPSARIILSAHGTDVSYSLRGGVKGWLYGRYQALGARLLRDAHVVANSHATARASRMLGWHNVEIVPLASDLRRPTDVKHMPETILFAGRLIKQKGLSWFVREVLEQLPPSIELTVAGTIWDRDEAIVFDYPRVSFLGPMSQFDLARLYAGALCVILPNIELPSGEFEGFGLTATEGACCGGVVLAAATGGLTEAVQDGETGFLLPPGQAEDWRGKIVEIYNWSAERRMAFTDGAMRTATKFYSWERVADETRQIYAAALSGHRE